MLSYLIPKGCRTFRGGPVRCRITGKRLVPHHANKRGIRYRHYVSAALITAADRPDGSSWRLPATELERTVRALIRLTLQDQTAVVRASQEAGIDTKHIPTILDRAQQRGIRLDDETEFPQQIIDRVTLQSDGIALTLRLVDGLPNDVEPLFVTRHHHAEMKRRGQEMRIVIDSPGEIGRAADPVLVKSVARGHRWFDELVSGRAPSLEALAAREGIKPRYMSRLMRMALLAPEIVQAIVSGRQPVELTADVLTYPDLPIEWAAQKAHLGFQ